MKKIFALLAALLLAFCAVGMTACGSGKIQIAVLQYAEHGSLDNCYRGVQEGLAARGYDESNVQYTF